MLMASLIAIFLIPVSFYLVERLGGEKKTAPPTEGSPAGASGGHAS
jgi:hypothetical protein